LSHPALPFTDGLDPKRLVSQQLDVALLLGVRLDRIFSDRRRLVPFSYHST
jgi:hypothetical protein